MRLFSCSGGRFADECDASRIGPLVLGCQDKSFRVDGVDVQFPVLPFRLVPYLVEHIVFRRYAGAWRFCPSTFHGEVRETEFFKFGGGAGVRKGLGFGLGQVFLDILLTVGSLALTAVLVKYVYIAFKLDIKGGLH